MPRGDQKCRRSLSRFRLPGLKEGLSPSHIHPTLLKCRNLANVMSVADAIRVRDRRTMAARDEIPRRCSRIPVAAKRPSHLRLVPNFVDNLDTTMASPRQIWVTLQTYMDVNIGWAYY